jgi:hypothetical protein
MKEENKYCDYCQKYHNNTKFIALTNEFSIQVNEYLKIKLEKNQKICESKYFILKKKIRELRSTENINLKQDFNVLSFLFYYYFSLTRLLDLIKKNLKLLLMKLF